MKQRISNIKTLQQCDLPLYFLSCFTKNKQQKKPSIQLFCMLVGMFFKTKVGRWEIKVKIRKMKNYPFIDTWAIKNSCFALSV